MSLERVLKWLSTQERFIEAHQDNEHYHSLPLLHLMGYHQAVVVPGVRAVLDKSKNS